MMRDALRLMLTACALSGPGALVVTARGGRLQSLAKRLASADEALVGEHLDERRATALHPALRKSERLLEGRAQDVDPNLGYLPRSNYRNACPYAPKSTKAWCRSRSTPARSSPRRACSS